MLSKWWGNITRGRGQYQGTLKLNTLSVKNIKYVHAFVYNSYMYNEYLHIIIKQIHFLDWKTLKTCSWPLTTRKISCDGIFLVGKVVWTGVCETAAPCDMPASLWLMTKQHPKKRISCIAIGSQSLKSEINILVLV